MKPLYLVVNNPKPAQTGLFEHIAAAEPYQENSRNGVLLRAESYLASLDREAVSGVLLQAAQTQPPPPSGADGPAFLKIRVTDPELHGEVLERFRETFQISRVKTEFFLRTVLLAYLIHLNAVPAAPPEAPAVDRLSLNLALSRLLADFSPEAEKKIGKIAEIMKEESTWA